MDEGKLKLPLLKKILEYRGSKNEGVVQSGRIGKDVAVIDIEIAKEYANKFYNTDAEVYLIEKSDPITFPTSEPGEHVVIINSNDIACSGALPYGFLCTIIANKETDFEEIRKIQEQIHNQCKKQNIVILGGHTEISDSVNSIIISGHMFGFVPKSYLIPNKLNIGEKIITIGHTGAEGIGIIIKEANEFVKNLLNEDEINEGERLGKEISISNISLNINKKFKPSLIHDATEGGIYGALTEIVAFTEVGIELEKEPNVSNVMKKLIEVLNFDPYRLISSGLIIVSVEEEKAEAIIKYCENKDIFAEIIGTVVKNKGEVSYKNNIIEKPDGDQITIALKELERFKHDKK